MEFSYLYLYVEYGYGYNQMLIKTPESKINHERKCLSLDSF